MSPKSQSVRACKIREEAGGVLTNVSTGQPFSYKDACVEYGPHLGHDPEATRQVTAGGDGLRAHGVQAELKTRERTMTLPAVAVLQTAVCGGATIAPPAIDRPAL